MAKPLPIYVSSMRVGDFLHLTPLMAATPVALFMEDTPQNRRVAPLADGLAASVSFGPVPYYTENVIPNRGVYLARRLLDAFGFRGHSCLPQIRLVSGERWVASQIVTRYRNPVAIRDIQGYGTERNAPPGLMQRVVDANRADTSFLSFGISATHPSSPYAETTLRDIIKLDDLPIRLVAACYACIGRYVGVDTGTYHLMLAVGGRCDVWVPPKDNTIGYRHDQLFYPREEWGEGAAQRLNYIEMTDSAPRSIIGLRYPVAP